MNYALAKLIGFALDAIIVLILLDVIGSWVLVMRVRLPDWAYTLLQTVHNAADIFLGRSAASFRRLAAWTSRPSSCWSY